MRLCNYCRWNHSTGFQRRHGSVRRTGRNSESLANRQGAGRRNSPSAQRALSSHWPSIRPPCRPLQSFLKLLATLPCVGVVSNIQIDGEGRVWTSSLDGTVRRWDPSPTTEAPESSSASSEIPGSLEGLTVSDEGDTGESSIEAGDDAESDAAASSESSSSSASSESSGSSSDDDSRPLTEDDSGEGALELSGEDRHLSQFSEWGTCAVTLSLEAPVRTVLHRPPH